MAKAVLITSLLSPLISASLEKKNTVSDIIMPNKTKNWQTWLVYMIPSIHDGKYS